MKNSAKFLQELYFAATPLELMRYKEDWKRILREHNLKKRQYNSSDSSGLIIAGSVITFILSLFCGVMRCGCAYACKNSKSSEKAQEPRQPPPNVVPMNQVDNSSEQPHHQSPSMQPGLDQIDRMMVPPTPYSLNQSWNTRS